jgi:hypothetical protein
MKEINKIEFKEAYKNGKEFQIFGEKWLRDHGFSVYSNGCEDKYKDEYRNTIKYSKDEISMHERFSPDTWIYHPSLKRQYRVEFKSSNIHQDTVAIKCIQFEEQVLNEVYTDTIGFFHGGRAQLLSNMIPLVRKTVSNEDFYTFYLGILPTYEDFFFKILPEHVKISNFHEELQFERIKRKIQYRMM